MADGPTMHFAILLPWRHPFEADRLQSPSHFVWFLCQARGGNTVLLCYKKKKTVTANDGLFNTCHLLCKETLLAIFHAATDPTIHVIQHCCCKVYTSHFHLPVIRNLAAMSLVLCLPNVYSKSFNKNMANCVHFQCTRSPHSRSSWVK
jgi:hypothetical protein